VLYRVRPTTCLQIAVIGREAGAELVGGLAVSARDVPPAPGADGTLMARRAISEDHRRSAHYEPVSYRPAQVNARFDLGFAVGLVVVIIACRRLSGGISGAPRRRLVGAAYRPRRGRRLDSAACP
jgi:hypothetical protein